jgi:DNA polymerase-3 subunit epsilon
MQFTIIDLETANADQSSICQLGLAKVSQGKNISVESSYVNPETAFSSFNISIHGITPEMVTGAQNLPEFCDHIAEALDGQIVLSHGGFDPAAVRRACEITGRPLPDCTWLNSQSIVRRAWPEKFAKSGYALGKLAKHFGIDFKHHDAGEDARVTAEIILLALTETQTEITDWHDRLKQPIWGVRRDISALTPNEDGPFYGSNISFTGALEIPRHEAATLASDLGFLVQKAPTKETDILVVGDLDARKLNGADKSRKQLKVEAAISKGAEIRIFTETDFISLFA